MHINWKGIKGKISDNLKKYFSTNVLFCSYVLLSLIISFLLRAITLGEIFSVKAFILDFTILLISGSFGYFFKPKKQFAYFFSLLSFNAILCVANSIYYIFYQSFLSVNLIATATMLNGVENAVTDRLSISNFIYLLVIVIFIFVHKKLCKKNYYFSIEKTENGKQMFSRTIAVGFAVMVLMLFTFTSSEYSRFIKLWNREYIVGKFGLYAYTINDLFQSLEPQVSTLFGYDEANREFREFYDNKQIYDKDNLYTDIFKDKNVLFIHAESMQNFLIDLEVNGIEITPNLNKLVKESLYFDKFYPQISVGTSSDTEFTLSTGLMPSSSGTVFVNYFNREYEAMPEFFNELGYYTFSMHANNADYWNRKNMYKTLGYQHFYAKDSFVVNEEDIIGLGLSDKKFFEQVVEKLKVINNENDKFMGTIISLTNHSPFNDTEKYGDLDFSITFEKETDKVDENGNIITEQVTVPYLEDTKMGNYLKSAHYADEAIGEFFESLDENGLLDDTVLILYGDHEAKLGKKQFNLLYNYDPITDSLKDESDPTYITINNYIYDLIKNTPFVIYSKDLQLVDTISDVMGMYDVLPTIGNMFGFYPKYALGNDIFSESEKIVIFPNGNFITNKVYYNSLKDEYMFLNNEPIDSEYITRLKEYTETRLNISKSIIVHDLIKNEK